MASWITSLLVLCICLAELGYATPLTSESKVGSGEWMHPHRSLVSTGIKVDYEDFDFWMKDGQDTLAQRLQKRDIVQQAKNTVFFLGDGMSVPTISAARVHKGQEEGLPFGEEGTLFFESFPNVGVSKTYCTDSQVADSACSATAYLCGTKTNIDMTGVKPSVLYNDCEAQMKPENHVSSILAWAQAAGKSTGIVTTTRITHASPSGTYAHIANRDWENDNVIRQQGIDPENCDDIAEQLILKEPGSNINVILGGGRREFLNGTDIDPETGTGGRRRDGKNLIKTWLEMKEPEGEKAKYVWNRQEFEAIDPANTDYLLGLFNYDHLDYALDSREDPSLADLTKKAIEILSKNPNGYFLFVEGGRIDHAHHDNLAQKSLVEVIEFDQAIKTAADMTAEEETLILVTADHAHVFSFAGYPKRGHPILGWSGRSDIDSLPYPTLSYANGPGYKHPTVNGGDRYDISGDDLFDSEYRQMSAVPLDSETHGGDDVLIYSRGPFSHLLTGNVQQSYIPHAIAYAMCVGGGSKYCDQVP